jgi:deoxyuridine 5'-triphosphate nucleotidohydrolase
MLLRPFRPRPAHPPLVSPTQPLAPTARLLNTTASKFMIDTGAGVIDADYRGTVHVLLFNLSDKDFEVEEGDRVAQLILERIVTPEVTEVEVSRA